MARPASRYPTELELQILKILWRDGPMLVRDVRKALADGPVDDQLRDDDQPRPAAQARGRKLAHTTVITILNTMVEKKYLRRTRDANAYVYHPRIAARDTTQRMLADLVERVFDGSAGAVMLSLLETTDIDDDELNQVRQLIDRIAKEKRS